jgi:DNA repair exonuclease SbcCD ATPase subunit
MRIVRLQAENVKRLRAVEITPDGNTVVISGRNGQGKTSVLDSIWFALGGGPATKGTVRPIRDGERSASVTLDLGELKVTRTWTGEKTALRVESAEGARYSSPQAMLDGLVGRLSFDPLAFSAQDDRAQRAALLDLIDLPFDLGELDRERAVTYERRTQVGRDVKQLQGQLAGYPEPAPDLPDEEVSAADLLAQAQQAERWQQKASELRRKAEDAQARVAHLEEGLEAARSLYASAAQEVAGIPADLPDPDSFTGQLQSIEETNRAVRAKQARQRIAAELDARDTTYEQMTDAIASIDGRKAAALREAKMPIAGLSFDETGVTYRGVPFRQCSAGERLRVSLAMAMAMNPSIRVIRITDGSLLDSDNMRLIEEMATAGDFQVWIERVDESGQVGIYIEDGQVADPAAAAS